jgi:hypothetical protein
LKSSWKATLLKYVLHITRTSTIVIIRIFFDLNGIVECGWRLEHSIKKDRASNTTRIMENVYIVLYNTVGDLTTASLDTVERVTDQRAADYFEAIMTKERAASISFLEFAIGDPEMTSSNLVDFLPLKSSSFWKILIPSSVFCIICCACDLT